MSADHQPEAAMDPAPKPFDRLVDRLLELARRPNGTPQEIEATVKAAAGFGYDLALQHVINLARRSAGGAGDEGVTLLQFADEVGVILYPERTGIAPPPPWDRFKRWVAAVGPWIRGRMEAAAGEAPAPTPRRRAFEMAFKGRYASEEQMWPLVYFVANDRRHAIVLARKIWDEHPHEGPTHCLVSDSGEVQEGPDGAPTFGCFCAFDGVKEITDPAVLPVYIAPGGPGH